MNVRSVCSSTHLFHYLINPDMREVESFIRDGIRPLSDFPESERWQALEKEMPNFYLNLYNAIAKPVLLREYENSGVFITPIDFRRLPGTYLHESARFVIPIDRLDPTFTVLTYVIKDERITLPFSAGNLEETAGLWDEVMVRKWFGIDQTKVFFYVPQVAAYQGRIPVSAADYENRSGGKNG